MNYPNEPGYVVGSDTSKAAAESINALSMRGIALETIKRAGLHGMTSDELEATIGMRHQTASARIRELALGGNIFDSGQRRKTRSGRNAAVWLAAA
jgi:predicted transcriptional regulator